MNQYRKQDSGTDLFLRTRTGTLPLALPPDWQLMTLADFPESAETPDANALASIALQALLCALPLEQQLKLNDTACILIEDLTRTSPEAVSAFGPEVVNEYRFFNHDCHASDLKMIGRLQNGIEVKINSLVHGADFRIGIGSIFPHPLNGFGGGGKILFPEVADYDSIFAHHLCHSFRENSSLGILNGNAFHDEVTAMALAGRLNFIVNSVLNHHDQLHQVIAGDPVVAHRASTEICRPIISKQIEQQSDITLIYSFPHTEGPQIMKPLAPAEIITRPGGTIILYADCHSPLPEQYFVACQSFRDQHGDQVRQAVLDAFANNQPILEGAPPELNMSVAQILLAQSDFNVILVTDDLRPDNLAQLGFIHAFTVQEAMQLAAELHCAPTVNIVPADGVILPVVRSGAACN